MAAKGDKTLDAGLLVLRIGLGAILFYYGLQHMFPIFGGSGIQGQLNRWEIQHNIPHWLGLLAAISEFAGSVGVIFGLCTRVAAFGIMCTMATAAFFGATHGGAISGILHGDNTVLPTVFYPLALMFMAAALMLTGAGKFSLDAKVFKKGG